MILNQLVFKWILEILCWHWRHCFVQVWRLNPNPPYPGDRVLQVVFSSYLRYQFYRSFFHLTWDTSLTSRLFILPEIPVLQVVFSSYLRYQFYRSSFHLTWDTSFTGRLLILPLNTSFTGRLFILPEIPVLHVVFSSYLRY